jgi:hypothetical protein
MSRPVRALLLFALAAAVVATGGSDVAADGTSPPDPNG